MAKKFNFKEMPVKVGGIAAGVAGAKVVNNLIVSNFPTVKPAMSGGAILIAGAVLPSFVKGVFMDNVGAGMMAKGADILLDMVLPATKVAGVDDYNQTTTNEYLMAGLGLTDTETISDEPKDEVISGDQNQGSNPEDSDNTLS